MVGLLLLIFCVAPAIAGKSPVGHISQKCDDSTEHYVKGPVDHGIHVTLFVTNSVESKCNMNMYAWCELEKDKPPHECQEASGPDAIHPGQTKSFTMKRLRYMTIRCEKCEGEPPCTGTFQLWK